MTDGKIGLVDHAMKPQGFPSRTAYLRALVGPVSHWASTRSRIGARRARLDALGLTD